jgi:hypothetical protein
MEIWKPVEGFKTTHEVSSLGRVRTVPRTFYGGRTRRDGTKSAMTTRQKCLRQWLSPRGYLVCGFSVDRRSTFRVVHRVVAEAFHGSPIGARQEVNHIDGNKLNNAAANLEWVTPSENTKHAYDTGLRAKIIGVDVNTAKLTEEQVRELRSLAAQGMSNSKLAAKFGITKGPVNAIIHRRTWKHVA